MTDEPSSLPPPPPLDYRPPGPEPRSQWWTDDGRGGPWVVGCLLALTAGGTVIGVVLWLLSFLVTGC